MASSRRNFGEGDIKLLWGLSAAPARCNKPIGQWPRFLTHDTTLLDGVEERQRGHALELASNGFTSTGFQYIGCLNPDFLPDEKYPGKINFQNHIILRFDDTEAGDLLGFRF